MQLNHTHDPAARSWLEGASGHADFPLQNLPFAVFKTGEARDTWRGGVAIADQVIDMAALAGAGLLDGLALQAAGLCAQSTLNAFMASGPAYWRALRHALFALLREGAPDAQQAALRACLVPQASTQLGLPAQIANYTDFYTSIHHARNVGRIAWPDREPLTPNFQWLPIAYHGRASSVVASGTAFHRPMGQIPGNGPGAAPICGACARLDYELELGMFIGAGNSLGQAIPITRAEDHVFGVCLLNDWSARDIQFWEMAPLGPFLGKNFCTSISPWVVAMEALAPFRLPFARPAAEPLPLPYLDGPANRAAGALDIRLEVSLHSERQRAEGRPATLLSRTSFKHQYWTLAQMVAQHTVGGCNLVSGDLLGSGTISGPGPGEEGALIEQARGGREPVSLGNGEERGFLQDGDTVVFRGWCEKPGAARLGFGECRGTVLPAVLSA